MNGTIDLIITRFTSGKEPEIKVEGHIDRTGSWQIKEGLAHQRSDAVK